jgi:hypothetical protein
MDYELGEFFALARSRSKRTVLRAPVLKQWSDMSYHARQARHSEKLPSLAPDHLDLLRELRTNGLACRDATALLPDSVVAAAGRFVKLLRQLGNSASTMRVPPEDLSADLALYKWGLSTDNLHLVENYLRLPVRYIGADVKRERADGLPHRARQWHLDVNEDRSIVRIVIYLVDVDAESGAFEYLDVHQTSSAAKALKYWTGFVSDAAMNDVVPVSHWRRVTGAALTATFVDPCRLFHRARPPRTADRYSMTFSYCSDRPYLQHPEMRLTRAARAKLAAELTPYQRRAATI